MVEFEVHEAFDGIDAISKISEVNPGLIILDLSMPGLNGMQTVKKIREMGFAVPIIMFAMHADEIPATAITSAQINAVVMKPDLKSLQRQDEFLLPCSV